MPETYNYIDLTYLRDFSNGDKKFMKEIILISIEQTAEELIHLKTALTEKEYAKVSRICHKLRSSMGFMGISKDLIAELKQLESLPADQHKEIGKRTLQIVNVCTVINTELRSELSRLEMES